MNVTAINSIYLNEDTGGKGRFFKSRFLQAGLVKYQFGVCLLKKETIDKFVNTFIGCPVVINHQDVTDESAKEQRVGVISRVYFEPSDAWFWCEGVLFDNEAIDLVQKGYTVSCQYEITEYSDNPDEELHNGNPYDKEILDGRFEHLAIVDSPRYEDAIIAVNSKANEYQPIIDYIENYNTGGIMDKETRNVFEKLISALKAKNEADDEKEKDDKAANDGDDKRAGIDKVAGILKSAGADEETIRTCIGIMEKLAYDKSEAGTADNKAKNEDEEPKDEKKDDKKEEKAENEGEDDNEPEKEPKKEEKDDKAANKCKNEDDELLDEVENKAKNKKAKNSMDALKKLFYEGAETRQKQTYITQKQAIELGKQMF